MIDPRTLRPLDLDTILESVRKTNRCVIVEEGWPHGGVGANLAALIQEQAFDYLDAPVAARHRRRRADAVLEAPRAGRDPARAEHVVSAALATLRGSRLSHGRRSSCRACPTRWRRARSCAGSRRSATRSRVGDELVEIETDKANMVYESDAAGTLSRSSPQEGDTLPIGEVDRAGRRRRRGAVGEATAARRGADAAADRRSRRRARARARRPPSRDAAPPAPAPATASATGASRPRRSPGGSRASAGVDLRGAERLRAGRADRQGRRRGGRWPTAAPRAGRAQRARGGPAAAAPPARRRGVAERARDAPRARSTIVELTRAPADCRAADGRVEGDRAALLPPAPRST